MLRGKRRYGRQAEGDRKTEDNKQKGIGKQRMGQGDTRKEDKQVLVKAVHGYKRDERQGDM